MSLNFESGVKWVGDNPVIAGGGIFALGILGLWATGFFSPSAAASGATDNSAAVGSYYDAVNADAQANAAEVIAHDQTTAATAQAQIGADAYTQTQTLWANTSLAVTNSNNNAAIASLPFAEEEEIVSTLGQLASLPGLTTAEKDDGFLGIGGGSSVTTTPNPVAGNAANGLFQYLDGHVVGH